MRTLQSLIRNRIAFRRRMHFGEVVRFVYDRKQDREAAAQTFARTFHFNVAEVHGHQLLGDGEAKPEPAFFSRGTAVSLAEALENMRQKLRTDSLAGVGNFHCRPRVALSDA